jgi:type IV pilus assembly protein PilA
VVADLAAEATRKDALVTLSPFRAPLGVSRATDADQRDDGFTLIELLVVVVIIGVLVAIAVPVYLNYRKGAADKSAQSDVRGAVTAVEQFYTDNGNNYPKTDTATNDGTATGAESITLAPITGTATSTQVITLSDKTQLGFVNTGTGYLICATSTGGSGKWYLYNSLEGGSIKASATTLSPTTCS